MPGIVRCGMMDESFTLYRIGGSQYEKQRLF